MAVFFELTTDVFNDRFDKLQGGPRTGRAGASSVRRPLRGLEVKEETYAMIKVIDLAGREIRLIDSGSSYGNSPIYTNFILQSVSEPRQEKFQLVETFGEPYAFFYGEAARYLECNCILINSQDFNWQAEFWENYDKHLRGSKCAEAGARVYLFYDDKIVEGYMLQAVAVNDSINPMAVQMQFKMFLTNYRNISLVGDPKFPIRLGVDVEIQAEQQQLPSAITRRTSSLSKQVKSDIRSKFTVRPLRGLIHDNVDEWTGPQPKEPPPEDPSEVDDLIQAAVDEAALNAANMDRVDSIVDSSVDKAQTGGGGPSNPGPPPGCIALNNCMIGTLSGAAGSEICKDQYTVRQGPVCSQPQYDVDPNGGLTNHYFEEQDKAAMDRASKEDEERQKQEPDESSNANASTTAPPYFTMGGGEVKGTTA